MEQQNSLIYCIRIAGHLDPSWSEWLNGAQIVHLEVAVSQLTATVRDQTALYSLLNRLRDLGLALLSVQQMEHSRREDA